MQRLKRAVWAYLKRADMLDGILAVLFIFIAAALLSILEAYVPTSEERSARQISADYICEINGYLEASKVIKVHRTAAVITIQCVRRN